ncbi:putative patatin-like phospholipase domain, Acyl transferase/acyl hydrolase/lysophospholipase [Helianthus annuus]|nr:putative patatin-like phospholipase domain, Acyl transferase/acyl hydrolase/lysophospholipase [Helianthus annuus]KAJ0542533.1 putative patatin-like phospholipase domain, Acyl transferase/acyl hydrolase/lysophospholipase [Helianthus annuus]KAJ0711582.1 putative patatin-like phospholipase domain, Acyl transferase/acyl hydrolase/lysophospholipase [Helianthus annuus]KAJ0815648.1 putative patatin-like phospholipase domain, Acyl transferase/acyl hydrolase/lysophospholipase [Helianthus annuus]
MDNKLTSEIFSILENNFLFGYQNPSPENTNTTTGKLRILSIDGGGATDGLLAAKSILHLETTLRRSSGNPNAHIADYFDVVAGAGIGGVIAALLFTKGDHDRPLFTAGEMLKFVMENGTKLCRNSKPGVFRRVFTAPAKVFDRTFGKLTLKDTLKTVLIPCYDLNTGAPFVFSRADAVEMDGCNGEPSFVTAGNGTPTRTALVKIVGEAVSDTVDQAVSMAFGQSRKSGYVRIQGNKGLLSVKDEKKYANMSVQADDMLKQHNVESVLFQGKRCNSTNLEKLEFFAGEILRENERRKTDMLPIVLLNQTTTSSSARTSSATTLSTMSSS